MNTDLIMKIKNSDAQASFIYCLSKHYHDITAQWEHKVKVNEARLLWNISSQNEYYTDLQKNTSMYRFNQNKPSGA